MLDHPNGFPAYDDRHHATYDALSVLIVATELLHRRVARGDLDPAALKAATERLRRAVARATAAVVALDPLFASGAAARGQRAVDPSPVPNPESIA